MELHFPIPMAVAIATALASSMSLAAVLPLDEPAMAVKIAAGDYVVRGRVVRVAETTFLPIEPPERVRVLGEEQTMTDERPAMYHLGTVLRKTLGPVDTGTRMFKALAERYGGKPVRIPSRRLPPPPEKLEHETVWRWLLDWMGWKK